MAIPRLRLRCGVLAALAAPFLLALSGSAQQVTYYNFSAPATGNQFSYSCSTSNPASNPLFCFNYQGGYQDPVFVQDSGAYAAQMTYPAGSQAASMWFSVPQKVSSGFNVWFQIRITPATNSTPADGIAFVIQNAQGGGTDPTGNCTETGQGPTAVGGGGGCIGYGGIDNSVALEFDTYNNGSGFGDPNNNHIALQDCGAGSANSPDHNSCLVTLAPANPAPLVVVANAEAGGTSTLVTNPTSSSTGQAVTLADGSVHDVVIVYNGPQDSPANTISVYLDPQYVEGTHTPVTGSTSLFTGPYDITTAMNLLASATGNDSAYVGFTSATGAAFETNEIVAWTFTPHTTVSQQQPLAPDDTTPGTTNFNFGTHTYAVTYPTDSYSDDTFSMGVIASTISQANFAKVLGYGASQYNGSLCQVYDDTGGNCIIYSEFCYQGSPSNVVACPKPKTSDGNPPTDCLSNPNAADCVGLLAAYNNSVQPTSPGYLQGDPLYSPVTSITGNGTTATVTCTGDCSVTAGQTVTILDGNDNAEFTGVTVNSTGLTINQFTFNSSYNGPTLNGGFITSSNVQDIFTGYTPQNVDGTTAGKTTNLGSDFVVTGTTVVGTQTQLSAPNNNAAIVNEPEELTATISPSATAPAGLTLLSIESIPATTPPPLFTLLPGSTISGTVTFSDSNSGNGYVSTPIPSCTSVPLTAVTVDDVTSYQAQCNYTPPVTGTDTITAQYSDVSTNPYHQSSQNTLNLNVSPQTVQVMLGTSPAGLTYQVVGPSVLTSGTYSSQQTLTWNIGTNYTLFIAATTQTLPSTPNTQYVFSQWSDGGSATDIVTASGSTTSYTAQFTTQYQLSVAAGAGGTVAGINGYYNAGTMQSITATPNPGYTFSGWSGTGSGQVTSAGGNNYSVTMSGPALLTANFTAVPTVGISPPSIDFGTLYLGDIATKTVQITNTGALPLSITDPRIAILPGTVIGKLSEFVTLNLCPKTLAVGKSCFMTVTFIAGPFYGQQNAALSIVDSAAGSPQTVMLTVNVIDPQATLSAGSLSFGSVKVGSPSVKSFTLTNNGGTTLSIMSMTVAGADPGDFPSVSSTCGTSVNAGKSCSISVTFQPTAKGTRTGTLVITDNAKNSPQSVSLTGTGK